MASKLTTYLQLEEVSAPTAQTDNGALYVKADGHLYFSSVGGSGGTISETAVSLSPVANNTNNYVVTATGTGLNGESNMTFDGSTLAVTGEISGSGVLNVVGAATLESTLHVSGAMSGAVALSAVSVSANDKAKLLATGEISGSGPLNVVGASTLESTLNVSGAISGAVGFSAVSVSANDKAKLLATGEISGSGPLNIVGAGTIEGALNVTGAILSAANISSSAGVLAAKSVTFGHDGNAYLNAEGGAELQGNLYVSGNMVINGTTTTVNSTTVTVDDPIFTIGGDTAPASDDNKDRGIEFNYHDGSSALVGFMGWDDSATAFTFLHTATNSSEVFSGTEATLKAGQISGSGELNIAGAATLESTLHVTGAVTTAAGFTGSLSGAYGNFNSMAINDGGTKSTTFTADTITTSAKLASTGEISGSGVLNIVGAATLESTLSVTGAILSAANISSSAGVLAAKSVTWGHDGAAYLNAGGGAELPGNLYVSGTAVIATFTPGTVSASAGITGSSLTINDTIELNANGNITKATSYSGSTNVQALNLYANNGGTNTVKILGTGEISGSGPLNIVGAATLESTLSVTGAITTAAAISSSVGITGSSLYINDTTRLHANGNVTVAGSVAGATTISGSSTVSALNFYANNGGTKSVLIKGDGTITAKGEISGSGALNIVGAATFENVLQATGAIGTSAGLSASLGVSGAYGHFNSLGLNQGGTNSITMGGDGTITTTGKFATSGEISGSSVLNVVGAATLESTLSVTGAILSAANISSSAGVLAGKSVTFGHAAGGFLNAGGGAELPGNLYVSGTTKLGDANSDVVTVTSQLTASEGMLVPDLAHLRFGTTGDIATMKYNSAAGYKNLHITVPPNGMLLTATGTTEPLLGLLSTHADATGPALQLCHFPSDNTAADDDVLGSINFRGQDSANNQITYGYIQGTSADVTDGTEDGKLAFNILIGGGNFEVATINTTGLTLPNTASHGLVTAHSFVTYSDERLKENIKEISNPIDKIKQLRGVTYDWRHDGTKDIGFIAQEVQKVVPSVVYENKGLAKEHYGLDYPKMNALLVEAIKEQQKQIENLKKVVKGLKIPNTKELANTRKRACSKCGKEGHDRRSCVKT